MSIAGCLLGTAVGDALGLCREGLSRRRGERMYPNLDRYQLFFGRGMGSDDTEHAAFTACALVGCGGDRSRFQRLLRHFLRRWFLSLPAGIGWATLRSSCKACLGLTSTGVRSAGNGPVMRAPVLGAWAAEHELDLEEWVRVSSLLTHTDPRALEGARLVACLTRALVRREEPELHSDDPFFQEVLGDLRPDEETEEFAARRGWERGVTGFVYPTVALVLQACLRHRDDFGAAVRAVIRCGGDTDTTAAIVGGVLGARLGKAGIPKAWLDGHGDWPLSLRYLEDLPGHGRMPAYPASLGRNLVFGSMIVGYALRRGLPPY